MRRNKKPLIYLAVFLLLFTLFIFILLRPSLQAKALNEIENIDGIEDAKAIWYKYKPDLKEDADFSQALRNKLASFNLKQGEITEIKKWLPSKTDNLNVIVVPDLSLRIKNSDDNPDQIIRDTTLISTMLKLFEKKIRLKMDSKDRFLVDVADPAQAQSQFRIFADSLIFDLSKHSNKSNRLYFSEQRKTKFMSNVTNMYNLAVQNTSGADYVSYFANTLKGKLKSSTLDDNYRNILIILTDGYLEIGKDKTAISISPTTQQLDRICNNENIQVILPVATSDITFKNVEAYLFEVNEKKTGQACHRKGLKQWWTAWFESMKISNTDEDFFLMRQEALTLNQDDLERIFK